MNIRLFKPSDIEAVLQIFYHTVHTTGAKYYDEMQVNAWAPEKLDKEAWLKSLKDHIAYVAEKENKLVGFGDMNKEGNIDRLYVLPEFQGQGVALALLKKLEEKARDLGLSEVTTEASIMAMKLAKRQGYQIVMQQRKVFREVEFTNYIMRKKLD